jgi:DNA-binding MarR family transcriptional regulator
VTRRSDGDRLAEGIVRLWAELQRRKDSRDASTHELTTSQAQTLRLLVLDGPKRIGTLAADLGVTMATASRTVDALVAAGLVEREPDPADARAVRVVLTARGKREYRVRFQRFARALDRLSDDLSELERRQLADALDSLARLFGGDRVQARASAGRPKS